MYCQMFGLRDMSYDPRSNSVLGSDPRFGSSERNTGAAMYCAHEAGRS